jgi:hypothetical protein
LPIGSATLPDGSASNAAPAIQRVKGSEAAPTKHYLQAVFDPATDEMLYWSFRMPDDYASGPVLKLLWTTNDVGAGESCVWGGAIGAVTAADADTPVEHALATASTTTTDVNTTEARRLIETSITLSNTDSVAAGDLVIVRVYRDADNAADDLSSDAELIAVSLAYQTT